MSRRPLVGLSADVEQARWGVWDRSVVLVPQDYVALLQAAGASVLVLPPDPDPTSSADAVEVLDALVLAGGVDVDPARYGQAPHPSVTVLHPERDATEFALLGAARERDLPVLGVCRGMQVMAVESGGRLVQHLPDELGSEEHRPGPARYGRHGGRTAPGSLAERVLGPRVDVSCYHHQGVLDPGTLRPTAWSDDGWVEALEEPGRRFALGVQWHPEAVHDATLFAALVDAALVDAAHVDAARTAPVRG